jgi:hypothetical protein
MFYRKAFVTLASALTETHSGPSKFTSADALFSKISLEFRQVSRQYATEYTSYLFDLEANGGFPLSNIYNITPAAKISAALV